MKSFLSKILPQPSGLRVLMYHKFSDNEADYLTVTARQFEEQLAYLSKKEYTFLKLTDVVKHIENGEKLPKNAILLTFDDAYMSQKEIAEPILRKYKANGVMFVPTAFVGKSSSWDADAAAILGVSELKSLDPSVWELGLHSHEHFNFKTAELDTILDDMTANVHFFKSHNLIFSPALAYPYGARPKDAKTKQTMQIELQKMGIAMAFRIGNRINKYPFQKLNKAFEIQRLDIRGTENFEDFKFKLTFGRLMG